MAKGIVVYYSQSGNTKKIAEAVHRGMSQLMEQCDITRIKDMDTRDLAKYDLIGMGSPVWVYKEPANVGTFIDDMVPANVEGKHTFSFCTHGTCLGNYFARVVPALIQRGMTVIGWQNWFCSVYFPVVPKPYFTDGHPDEVDLKEAEDFGREMVERSRRIYSGEANIIPSLPRGSEYDEIYDPGEMPPAEVLRAFYKVQSSLTFTVDREKCNYPECTFCIDNCPMDSIDFSESPPVFNINCDKCFLCEQTCPRGAISIDCDPYSNAHLPMIPPLENSLAIFEARGRFRRLVPPENIGWNTFLWKKQPPRFKPG